MVISPDFLNERSPTIIVACVTSKKTQRIFRNEVVLEPPEGGLKLRSKIMLSQIRTIDKTRLVGFHGQVSEDSLARIDDAIRISLGLVPF